MTAIGLALLAVGWVMCEIVELDPKRDGKAFDFLVMAPLVLGALLVTIGIIIFTWRYLP